MFEIFIFENLYFSISILGAFVFLSLSFLHFDAWNVDKNGATNLFTKGTGFLLLAFYNILEAVALGVDLDPYISEFILFFGLILVFVSLFFEKVLTKPDVKSAPIALVITSGLVGSILSTLLFLLIALQYKIKATKGLHKELKPMYQGFFLLFLAQLAQATLELGNSSNIFVAQTFAEYGYVWIAVQILKVLAYLFIGKWILNYVRFRLNIQIFILLVGVSFAVFVTTTFMYTYILMKSIESDVLSHLQTDTKVLQYSVERLQGETLSNARAVAVDSVIQDNFVNEDNDALITRSTEYMFSQNNDFLMITDENGKVVMRADDQEKVGESLSEDPLVNRALSGNQISTITGTNDPLVQRINITAVAPLIINKDIVGSVITGQVIDDAFSDNVKDITGLDITLYAGDKRATTTLLGVDGVSRFVGTKETNEKVVSEVLENGNEYVGENDILGEPYYAVYTPLRSLDDEIIGMIFVGKPQTELIQSMQESISLTFLGSVVLMLMSIIPAFFIAKYLESNILA